jgi:hypothetical protein
VTAVWRALHVVYYDDDKDQLIALGVRPFLEGIADGVQQAYFLRHWLRGPHLRIPILAPPQIFATLVEPTATRTISSYLDRCPSRALLPPEEQLLAMHQLLSESEREPGPLRPLAADNSVFFAAHDRRLPTVGGEAGADLLADFYGASNQLTFRMLDRIRAGRDRESLALSLMLAVGHSLFNDQASASRGFVSFRSHAEAFLHTCSDPDATRARFDRQYQANRAAIQRMVTAVFDTLERGTDAVPFVSEWVALLRPFSARAEALIRSGALTLPEWSGSEGDAGPWAMLRTSPLHQAIDRSPAFQRLLRDPGFQRYRLILNYTYLHLARLGVMALARYRLCHLAANAIDEALGINLMARVQDFAAGDRG